MSKKSILLIAAAALVAVVAICFAIFYRPVDFEAHRNGQSAYGVYSLRAYGSNGQNAADDAAARIAALEILVQGQAGSDVERINAAQGDMTDVNPATLYLIEKAVGLYNQTLGYFSIADLPARHAWGLWDGEYDEQAVQALSSLPGMEGVYADFANTQAGMDAGGSITLTDLLGGYAADQAAAIARDYRVQSGLFSVGEQSVALGARPNGGWWSVTLPHPTQAGESLGVLLLRDQACATVGAFAGKMERDGQTYAALIDPTTMAPTQSDILSVTVVANSALEAQALAKAALLAGRVQGESFINSLTGAQAIFVMRDGSVYLTPGLADRFSLRAQGYSLRL